MGIHCQERLAPMRVFTHVDLRGRQLDTLVGDKKTQAAWVRGTVVGIQMHEFGSVRDRWRGRNVSRACEHNAWN